jgi:hypothetical protein
VSHHLFAILTILLLSGPVCAQSSSGTLNFFGSFEPTGGTDLSDATGLTWSPTQDGVIGAADGDLTPFGPPAPRNPGEAISLADISLTSFSTVDPFLTSTDTESGDILTFALTSMTVVKQEVDHIILVGEGTYSLTGFDTTTAAFLFEGFYDDFDGYTYIANTHDGPLTPPDITFQVGFFDVGGVEIGETGEASQLISNLGETPVEVTLIERCKGTSAEFTSNLEPPLIIGKNQGALWTVTYEPVDAGEDNGCFVVESNDPDESPLEMSVTGTALSPMQGNLAVGDGPGLPYFLPTGGAANTSLVDATGFTFHGILGITEATGDFIKLPQVFFFNFTFEPFAGPEMVFGLGQTRFDLIDFEIETRTENELVLDGYGNFRDTNIIKRWALSPVTFRFESTGWNESKGGWDYQAEFNSFSGGFPTIWLDPSGVNFGPEAVDGTNTREVTVRNLGGLDLNVGPISLCDGTSAEFGWSPVGLFTVAPSETQVLTLTYQPDGEGADAGCLSIPSNDQEDDPMELAVSGKGVICTLSDIVLAGEVVDQAEEIVACDSITVGDDTDLLLAVLVAGGSVAFTDEVAVHQLTVVIDPDLQP